MNLVDVLSLAAVAFCGVALVYLVRTGPCDCGSDDRR